MRIVEQASGLRRHRLPAEDRKRAVTALDDELILIPGDDRAGRYGDEVIVELDA